MTTRTRGRSRSGPGRGPGRRLTGLVPALLGLALLAAACGESATTSSGSVAVASSTTAASGRLANGDTAAGGTAPPTTAAGAKGASPASAASGSPATSGATSAGGLGSGGATVTPSAADTGRKLIFTAKLNVAVDDVNAASGSAATLVEGLGGFLYGQNTTGGAAGTSELTFKVPPANFNQALAKLGTVGELRNQTITTDDATGRIVDLDARIHVAELGVQRLQSELAATKNITDYAAIEQTLLQRETDLEVMRGQIRSLQQQVDLATIVVSLTRDKGADRIQVAVTAYPGHDSGRSCPGQTASTTTGGEDLTVCFEVTNQGDQTLTHITLTDTVLGISPDTVLRPVSGSLDSLAPGQAAIVAFDTAPERSIRLRTRVSATPTNGISPDPTGAPVTAQAAFDLTIVPAHHQAGFGDGASAGVAVLAAVWRAVVVTVGFVLPLLVFAPVLYAAWKGLAWWRRRRPASPGRGRGRGGQPAPLGPMPPPPAAPPPPAPNADTDPDGNAGPPEREPATAGV